MVQNETRLLRAPPPRFFQQETGQADCEVANASFLLWIRKDDADKSHGELLPQPWDLIKDLQLLPSYISESLWTSDFFVFPTPPLLKKWLCHLEIRRDATVMETKRCPGTVSFQPGSPECHTYCLVGHFWLLFTSLTVSRVYVRKLKQSGDFLPPHVPTFSRQWQ